MIRSESVTGTPTLALPPGTLGLPYLGETLAFLRNPFRFLEDRQRRHGHVWKSRLLGRRIVFLAGTEGAQAFYDPATSAARTRTRSRWSTCSAASTWRCTTAPGTRR